MNIRNDVIAMRHPAAVPCICSILLAAVLLAAGCTLPFGGKDIPVPGPVTTVLAESPAPSGCGFSTCHGLDLACSPDAPQMCTMEYHIGDKCRQYARCEAGSGGCRLVTEPEFAACRACVEQCQTEAGPAAFSCEEKC